MKKAKLDLEENIQEHRFFWVVKRICRFLMLLIVLAALLGAFGDGRLSERFASLYPEFKLQYDYFLRYKKNYSLNCFLNAEKLPDTIRIWISHDYLHQIKIEKIQPEPLKWEIGRNRVYFVFPVREKGSFQRVTFSFNAEKFGSAQGRIGLDNMEYSFKQFIYP